MPCWIALPIPDADAPRRVQSVRCALAFTPRVTLDLPGAVLMEVKASRRLFGGEEALFMRLGESMGEMDEATPQGLPVFSAGRGQTAHAALASLKAAQGERGWFGHWHGLPARWLDPLPCTALAGWEDQGPWLSTLGIRTVAQLRALPRTGLARRLGPGLLRVLDQALGQAPEVWSWVQEEAGFELWREFADPQSQAGAWMAEVQPMLDRLLDWLDRRQSGVRALSLHWRLDHAKGEPPEGSLTLHLAQASRDRRRLERLLAERLGRVVLHRPALGLTLRTQAVERLSAHAGHLFRNADAPEGAQWQDAEVLRTAAGQREQALRWDVLLEQLAARLGERRVLRGGLQADHRPEMAQQWWPSGAQVEVHAPTPSPPHAWSEDGPTALPLPTWLLDPPRPLPWQSGPQGLQPTWHGLLQALTGPHRIATAWWDARMESGTLRDYVLMHSPAAGLVWVCRERHGSAGATPHAASTAGSPAMQGLQPWRLHGLFA